MHKTYNFLFVIIIYRTIDFGDYVVFKRLLYFNIINTGLNRAKKWKLQTKLHRATKQHYFRIIFVFKL